MCTARGVNSLTKTRHLLVLLAALVAVSLLVLCSACGRSDDASSGDPTRIDPPRSAQHTFSDSELGAGGGQAGVVPGMAAARIVLHSSNPHVDGLTGRDFDTIEMGSDGLTLEASKQASGGLMTALKANGAKAIPVDITLDGRVLAHAWVVYPGDDSMLGPEVSYQGLDAVKIYRTLAAR